MRTLGVQGVWNGRLDTMDPVWRNLPEELTERVCNKLPEVRRVPDALKRQICGQRWMLTKVINSYIRCEYMSHYDSLMALKMDLGGGDVNVTWMEMTPEARWDFFNSCKLM